MSARAGQWDDDDFDNEDGGDQTQTMKELRNAYKALQKKNQTLEAQVAEFAQTSRKSAITDLLKARDLNPKIAAFIPPDVEANEESLGRWLTEYGDVFGAQPKQERTPSVPEGDVAAMRQMDVLAGSTSPAEANDMLKRVQSAESPEAIIALIESAGGRVPIPPS